MEERVYTRREMLDLTIAGAAGAMVTSACNGCGVVSRDIRQFRVGRAFRWEPADAIRDVAFSFVSDRIVDYVDGLCDGCGAGMRFFLFGVDVVATAATIHCPGCSVGTRLMVAATRELISEMASHGFYRALGVVDGGSYLIRKVGPLQAGSRQFRVSRSAVCYAIEDREPSDTFPREIAAFPERISYFTEVAAAPGQDIFHVWRCNGQLTDRIRLDADSQSWRTWSTKENLARGAWIVTTEMPSGDVLDMREFHIV